MQTRSMASMLALCALALSLPPPPARAQEPAAFHAGKTVTVVVGYGAGAAYDTGARMIARHLGRHIPGRPTVVVQNMPGAGSMTAANHLYNAAAKDGTAIGLFGRGLFLEALFGNPLARFDPLQFNWIGSHGSEVTVLVTGAKTPFKTVADIQRQEIILGASGPGADTHSFALALAALIDAKVKIVSGFPGQADAFLAMDRGEVHGNAGASIGTLMSLRPQWLSEPGHANFIVQLAPARHPKFFQGVPLVADFAKSDLDRQALELAFARQAIAYPLTAPPGVPDDRVKALRAGFMGMVRDPDFLADATKMNADVSPVSGEGVNDVIRRAFASPKPVIERARAALSASAAK